MAGHARVGRTYAGRVLQLITGSTGIDDWEWGVTLLADDPVALKEIVYEMRFDPVSARYAEFGPFFTGLVLAAADACARVGLRAEDDVDDRAPTAIRLFVSFPEELVERPMIYEIVKRFDVVPNIRRANVEAHSALGDPRALRAARRARSRRSRISRAWAAPSTAWKATSSPADAGVERPGSRVRFSGATISHIANVTYSTPSWVSVRPARRSSPTHAFVASKPSMRLKSATATSSGPSASPSRRTASTSSTGWAGSRGSMHAQW